MIIILLYINIIHKYKNIYDCEINYVDFKKSTDILMQKVPTRELCKIHTYFIHHLILKKFSL